MKIEEGEWREGMIEFWEVDLGLKSFGIDFKIFTQPPNIMFILRVDFNC